MNKLMILSSVALLTGSMLPLPTFGDSLPQDQNMVAMPSQHRFFKIDPSTISIDGLTGYVNTIVDLSSRMKEFCGKETPHAEILCRPAKSHSASGSFENYRMGDDVSILSAQILNSRYDTIVTVIASVHRNMNALLDALEENKKTKEKVAQELTPIFEFAINSIEASFWSHTPLWLEYYQKTNPFDILGFFSKAFDVLIQDRDFLVSQLTLPSGGQQYILPSASYSPVAKQLGVLHLSIETLRALPCSDGNQCKTILQKLGYDVKETSASDTQDTEPYQQQANECQKDLGTCKAQLREKADLVNALKNQQPKGEYASSSKLQAQNTPTAGKAAVTSGVAYGATRAVDVIVKEVAAFSPQNVESLLQSWNGYVVAQNQVGRDLKWNAIETLQSSFMFQGYKIFNPNTKELLQHDLRAAARLNLSDKITSTVVAIIDSTKKAAQNPVGLMVNTAKFLGPVVAVAAGEWCVSCLLTNYLNVTPACANVAAHGAGVGALALATGGISLVGLGVDAATYTLFGGLGDIKTCYNSVVYKKKTA